MSETLTREQAEWWASQDYSGGIPKIIAPQVQALARWALERDAEAKRLETNWSEADALFKFHVEGGCHRERDALRIRVHAAEAKLADAEREIEAARVALGAHRSDEKHDEGCGCTMLSLVGVCEWHAAYIDKLSAKLAAGRAEAERWIADPRVGIVHAHAAAEAIRRAMDDPSSSAATPPSPPR